MAHELFWLKRQARPMFGLLLRYWAKSPPYDSCRSVAFHMCRDWTYVLHTFATEHSLPLSGCMRLNRIGYGWATCPDDVFGHFYGCCLSGIQNSRTGADAPDPNYRARLSV